MSRIWASTCAFKHATDATINLDIYGLSEYDYLEFKGFIQKKTIELTKRGEYDDAKAYMSILEQMDNAIDEYRRYITEIEEEKTGIEVTENEDV